MLKMTNINKVFTTEVVRTNALTDFSLHVNEGEFLTVTGPSGCGKTTFLNIAGLLETYSSGQYLLDGQTGNLDSNTAEGVMTLLQEINARGTTIIMVTHDPDLALRSDRNVQMLDGQIQDIVTNKKAAAA